MQHDPASAEPTLARWRAALLRAPALRCGLPGDAHAVQAWGLQDDELAHLLAGAAPRGTELEAVERDPAAGPALVLAYSMERFGDLLDDQPPPSLRPWVDGAFAASCGSDDRLRLIDRHPLAHWLRQWREEGPGPRLELRDHIARRFLHTATFSGRCHVCDFGWPDHTCGDPMCRSEFAEARDGRLLWYMDGGAEGLRQAWLLPQLRLIGPRQHMDSPPA